MLIRTIATAKANPGFSVLTFALIASLLAGPFAWQYMNTAGHVGGFTHTDFGVYYTTVGDWLAGEPIYDVDDPFGGYLYMPVYLLVVLPLYELFEWTTAAEVWAVVTVGALWLGLQALVWTYVPDLSVAQRLVLAPVSLILLLGFHPIWYGMRLGQASAGIAAIVTFAAVAMERANGDRSIDALSGILTAVGGTVKLFYAPVGAHLLLDRIRLLAATAMGAGLIVASVGLFGGDTFVDYLQVLAWGEDWGADPAHPSWGWISGYYRPLYYLGELSVPLLSVPLSLLIRLGLIAGVICIALWVRETEADTEVFALGIVLIPLVGPQVSTHDFAVLLPALVMLGFVEHRRDGHRWLVVLAAVLFHWQAYGTFLAANLPDSVPLARIIIEYSPLLQPALYANVALIGLAAYRVLEYRPPQWLFDRSISPPG